MAWIVVWHEARSAVSICPSTAQLLVGNALIVHIAWRTVWQVVRPRHHDVVLVENAKVPSGWECRDGALASRMPLPQLRNKRTRAYIDELAS